MPRHTAHMYIKGGEGRAECLDCSWVGPTHPLPPAADGTYLIAADCTEHEDEIDEDNV